MNDIMHYCYTRNRNVETIEPDESYLFSIVYVVSINTQVKILHNNLSTILNVMKRLLGRIDT